MPILSLFLVNFNQVQYYLRHCLLTNPLVWFLASRRVSGLVLCYSSVRPAEALALELTIHMMFAHAASLAFPLSASPLHSAIGSMLSHLQSRLAARRIKPSSADHPNSTADAPPCAGCSPIRAHTTHSPHIVRPGSGSPRRVGNT